MGLEELLSCWSSFRNSWFYCRQVPSEGLGGVGPVAGRVCSNGDSQLIPTVLLKAVIEEVHKIALHSPDGGSLLQGLQVTLPFSGSSSAIEFEPTGPNHCADRPKRQNYP